MYLKAATLLVGVFDEVKRIYLVLLASKKVDIEHWWPVRTFDYYSNIFYQTFVVLRPTQQLRSYGDEAS